MDGLLKDAMLGRAITASEGCNTLIKSWRFGAYYIILCI